MMTLYRYEAAAASGELVSGEIEALSQDAVIEHLHAQGYVPIRADLAKSRLLAGLFARKKKSGASHRRVNLVFLTQQLATLLHAGLSLDRALEIGETVSERKGEQETLRAVLDKVRGGSSLADSMAAQDDVFPAFYLGMVRAGEAGGSLDVTLRHLAELLERSQAAREQVKSALVYPCVVLATGAASVGILFGFVIPRFRPLFEEAGTALPLTTQLVLALSDGFRDYWWLILGIIVLLVFGWRRYVGTTEGRRRWDAWLLRLPLIGDLITKIEISRFSRTLGTLLRNGVSPLAALAITQETVTNMALREGLATVVESVKEGRGFADPLARTQLVPALAVNLTRVGEETAKLDDMLLKVGEIYEQESRRSVERLLALLVPAVTVGLGVVVALVIGSILSAVLSVYDLAL
jgi:general secretion pathway protein F